MEDFRKSGVLRGGAEDVSSFWKVIYESALLVGPIQGGSRRGCNIPVTSCSGEPPCVKDWPSPGMKTDPVWSLKTDAGTCL